MLRIDTVISDETYSESLVEDTSDSRPKTQFLKDTMVDINPADIQTGWQFKGTTNFGFDYTPQGTIREINFGQVFDKGASVEIAGSKEIRNGFNVCLKCGALLGEHGSRHAYFCPERKKAQEQQLEQSERNARACSCTVRSNRKCCACLCRDLPTSKVRTVPRSR